jgi:hypothetical protein
VLSLLREVLQGWERPGQPMLNDSGHSDSNPLESNRVAHSPILACFIRHANPVEIVMGPVDFPGGEERVEHLAKFLEVTAMLVMVLERASIPIVRSPAVAARWTELPDFQRRSERSTSPTSGTVEPLPLRGSSRRS